MVRMSTFYIAEAAGMGLAVTTVDGAVLEEDKRS